jgi:hypothetical protein
MGAHDTKLGRERPSERRGGGDCPRHRNSWNKGTVQTCARLPECSVWRHSREVDDHGRFDKQRNRRIASEAAPHVLPRQPSRNARALTTTRSLAVLQCPAATLSRRASHPQAGQDSFSGGGRRVRRVPRPARYVCNDRLPPEHRHGQCAASSFAGGAQAKVPPTRQGVRSVRESQAELSAHCEPQHPSPQPTFSRNLPSSGWR